MSALVDDLRELAEKMREDGDTVEASLLVMAAAEVEGGAIAYGHIVEQKRELEQEVKRLRDLLQGAYDIIARNNAQRGQR